jgi:restriction system protein
MRDAVAALVNLGYAQPQAAAAIAAAARNTGAGADAAKLIRLGLKVLSEFGEQKGPSLLSPTAPLSLSGLQSLLSPTAIGPPHGFELLKPFPIPKFPEFPSTPAWNREKGFLELFWGKRPPPNVVDASFQTKKRIFERAEALQRRGESLRHQFEAQYQNEAMQLNALRDACMANELRSIGRLLSITHLRHGLPSPLQHSFQAEVDPVVRIVLCTIEIPDFRPLNIVKERGSKWVPISASERKRAMEVILYSLCLRASYLVGKSDEGNWFDIIAVNAKQNWIDPATGSPRSGIIASLQAAKEEMVSLRLDQVDPKACFRHLKGIATPSVEQVSPVRPIFVLNKDDKRIIQARDIVDQLEPEANLAAMPWDDFEHLVRQLFEWEFGRDGVEIKVTRASRDRGVDAIMFDPDPLRGGKFVLQAKRYTRPVDVAAVRDLYGTVVNEGANRGILVTTSSYGPDAYDFAKDKPISLVDGPNLIAMLRKHGRRYRVDLAEARRLAASNDSEPV